MTSINLEEFNFPSRFKKPDMNKTILDIIIASNYDIHSQSITKEHTGKRLLNIAATLLERGYSLDTEIEPLLDVHGNVKPLKIKE